MQKHFSSSSINSQLDYALFKVNCILEFWLPWDFFYNKKPLISSVQDWFEEKKEVKTLSSLYIPKHTKHN